jgi:hypothetical protein
MLFKEINLFMLRIVRNINAFFGKMQSSFNVKAGGTHSNHFVLKGSPKE